MNFLVKHVLVNVVGRKIVQGVVLGIEYALVKTDPARHAEYVEHMTELFDAKTEAFVVRNAALRLKYAPGAAEGDASENEVWERAFEETFAKIADVLNKDKPEDS
jgi:predicted alpha-1,6-mannanase (GH76 family)